MTFEIVNIVGSGSLDQELELSAVADTLEELNYEIKFDKQAPYRLFVRLEEDAPKITIFRSGDYHIPGCDSEEELKKQGKNLHLIFDELGIIDEIGENKATIRNVVASYDLDSSFELSTLSVHLGFENVEYEPEQFPGLVYRPPDSEGVIMIFSTGKGIITGLDSIEKTKNLFKNYCESLPDLPDLGR